MHSAAQVPQPLHIASNAVMAAAQGRRGPTVTAVGSAAQAQYNWDVEFSELSRDIQTKGLDSMALSASKAAQTTSDSAMSSMLGSAISSYAQYSMIGASTKPSIVKGT